MNYIYRLYIIYILYIYIYINYVFVTKIYLILFVLKIRRNINKNFCNMQFLISLNYLAKMAIKEIF